ncbi:MAG: TMAO reductase system periplasmic protein TorT [Bradyrhizobium sp.]|nr:MAG: TMAO reductase system periplasmic protein TorT [Bradyrhizobium sp.]
MTSLFLLVIFVTRLALPMAMAEDAWYPVQIDVWSPPFNAEHQHELQQYTPPGHASRAWRICASIPHLKDDYWLAVNFGLVNEAKRMGVALNLYEAGGYENLATQQSQIAECVTQNKADALIIGAISADGLNSVIADYSAKGMPVIDLINGINSDKIAARVAADFYDMGLASGKYLTALQSDKKAAKVAWFPGPAGAAWVAAGDKGFRAALNGSSLSVIDGGFGDTGIAAQTRLIEAVLDSHPDIDFIAGTAVSAEAAVQVLQKRKLEQQIKVIAYYFGPGVYRAIKRGAILAAPSDSQEVLARISIDQAVRALEKQKMIQHLGVTIKMVDLKSLSEFDLNSSIAPAGFRPIFSVAP